jgi:hypothetical protein
MFLLSGIKVVSSERIIIGFNDIIAASYLKTALKKADILSTYPLPRIKTKSNRNQQSVSFKGYFIYRLVLEVLNHSTTEDDKHQ